MKLEVVILAAGQGTRMQSSLPKVLHTLAGRSLLQWAVAAAATTRPQALHIVIGHGAEQVRQSLDNSQLRWVLQSEQKGTGHAVAQVLPELAEDAMVLITYGDVPLVAPATLTRLLARAGEHSMGLLTVTLADPSGYGRIVRGADERVEAIVEQKDASEMQLAICEVNTGIMAVSARHLRQWLPRLSAENAQGEYYLTDIVAMAVAEGVAVETEQPEHLWEVEGVNSRQQLQGLERKYQLDYAERLMAAGVGLADAQRIDVRGSLIHGRDVNIDVNCVFEGEVELGEGVSIGPNCLISNSRIAAGSVVKAQSVVEDSIIGENCTIGPFARLRPGTVLADDARVGNFVETKNAQVGRGSKINHLSYVGDASLGERVNIGAGTITCNYDGVNKSRTVIGDDAFIGSNTALVAPVAVGSQATVAAGSTITGNIADGELGVARGRQRNITGWQRPKKNT